MDKKAQVVGIGTVIIVAITLIVGIILLIAVSNELGKSTNTVTWINHTYTPSTNGTSFYLTGIKSISSVVITNATNGALITSGNYTVTNNVLDTNEVLSVGIAVHSSHTLADNNWNISGTSVQPTGYITDSGGRALAGLIIVLFALAIAVVAISPTLRSGLADMIGK